MSLHAKLKAHLATHAPTWADDDASARWTDAGGATCLLLVVPRALTAADVVDAHLAAQQNGGRATLAFDGAATDVARRTARRLGVELLDAATLALPEPSPVESPAFDAAAVAEAPPMPEPAFAAPMIEVEAPLLDAAPAPMPTVEAGEPLALPALEAEAEAPVVEIAGLLPARFDVPAPVEAAPAVAEPPVLELVEALVESLADEEPILLPAAVPVEAPAPLVMPAPRRERVYALDMPEALVEVPLEPLAAADGPALPWLVGTASLAPEPAAPAVAAHELAALPWHAAAPAPFAAPQHAAETEEEDGAELLPSTRPLRATDHPTVLPGWGLPWPRPGATPAALTTQAQRAEFLRDRLAQARVPTLGAPKPASAGSAWLKDLQVERA